MEHRQLTPRTNRMLLAVLVLASLVVHLFLTEQRFSPMMDLDPDCSEYVIGSYAISKNLGFSNLSYPDHPKISARQPGTAWLLAPVTASRGFDVWACKHVVQLTGILAVGLLAFLAWRVDMSASTVIWLIVLSAVNPFIIRCHMSLYSEPPFLMWLALAFVLLPNLQARNWTGWLSALVIGICIGIAIRTRIMGVAMLPALLAYVIVFKFRRDVLARCALAGIIPILIFLLTSQGTGSGIASYLQMFTRGQNERMLTDIVINVMNAFYYYTIQAWSILVPHYWSGLTNTLIPHHAIYSRIGMWLGFACGLAMCFLAVRSLLRPSANVTSDSNNQSSSEVQLARRATIWTVVVVTLIFTLMLIIWPRQDRLIYPVLMIVLLGIANLLGQLRSKQTITVAILLLVPYLDMYAAMFRPADKTTEPATMSLGTHLRQVTKPSDRAMVELHDIFHESGRFQYHLDGSQIGSMSASQFNQALMQHQIRYLAINSFLDEPMVHANPAYRAERLQASPGGPTVIRLSPNRTGVCGEYAIPPIDFTKHSGDSPFVVLMKGRDAYRRGKLQEAKEILTPFFATISQSDDAFPPTAMLLGDVCLELAEYDSADQYYRKAVLGVSHDIFQRASSQCLLTLAAYRRASNPTTHPERASELWESFGRGESDVCRWSHALAKFDRAIALASKRITPRLRRAFVLQITGKQEQARNELVALNAEIEKRLQANEPVKREELAELQEHMVLIIGGHLLTQAKASSLRCAGAEIEIDPADPESWLNFADLFEQRTLQGVALALCESACDKFANHAGCWLARGKLEYKFGLLEEASRSYTRAVELNAGPEAIALQTKVAEQLKRVPVHPLN